MRIVKSIVAMGLMATLMASIAQADVPTSCSLATLRGTMAWSGMTVHGNVWRGSSGFESYDGRGNMRYTQLGSDGISKDSYVGTATYTITANCVATVVYDGDTANAWTYFVAPDGSAYFYNNNLGLGGVSAGKVERISRALLV